MIEGRKIGRFGDWELGRLGAWELGRLGEERRVRDAATLGAGMA